MDIFEAAENGDIAFIKKFQGDVNDVKEDGKTALMWAAEWGHTEAVIELLGSKAQVNAADEDGKTALMWAVLKGAPKDLVKELIKAGADVNAADMDGWTALIYAAAYCKREEETIELLIAAGVNVDEVDKASCGTGLMLKKHTYADVVKELIKAGADVNVENKNDGWTTLIYAAYCGDTEMVKTLIEAKADVNKKNKDGKTALLLTDDPDIIKLLKQAGAK